MTNMDYLFAFLIVSIWKCFIKEMALGDLLLSVETLRIVKGVSLARWHLLYFFLPSTIVYLDTFQPIFLSFYICILELFVGTDGELGVFLSIFVSSNTRTMATRKDCVRKEEAILRAKLSTLSAQHAGLIILNELEFLNCDQLSCQSIICKFVWREWRMA